ncbi:hypothetical protein GGP41_008755 [Bipolaris sorokiniana]|uniref:Mitochondrial carrier protein n=1 Tax=Cochliobolus sativus TaxID=45130 RepID=A0A8H6DQU9_COCSA|nr:hypothetical protein GGP41_008755 [Bipolaris sorokiniana]
MAAATARAHEADANPATEVSLGQKMLSAVSGSLLTSLLVTPLDVVRVRLQSQEAAPSAAFSRPSGATGPSLTQFRDLPPNLGISACCREVFWVNNKAPFCVAGPTMAPINPADLHCAVEEVERRTINSTWDGLRKIAQNEGPRTLWRGLSPTLVMTVPANVIYFAGYDWLRTANQRGRRVARDEGFEFRMGRGEERVRRRSRSRSQENHRDTLVDSFVAGATSGAVAAFVTTPFDVGKTRQQVVRHMGDNARDVARARPEDQSIPRFLMHIYREQGMPGLFKGWAARCLKIAPACAIMISCYEFSKKIALDMNERREQESRHA